MDDVDSIDRGTEPVLDDGRQTGWCVFIATGGLAAWLALSVPPGSDGDRLQVQVSRVVAIAAWSF